MAAAILGVFLMVSYKLFIGGQKTATKAAWTNFAVDRLRNATQLINQELKKATFPTTLLTDAVKDPSNVKDLNFGKEYFVKIHPNSDNDNGGKFEASEIPDNSEKIVMKWVICEPERPPQPGKMQKKEMVFIPVKNTLVKVGQLRVRSRSYTYDTTGLPNYVESVPAFKPTEIQKSFTDTQLLDDVQWIRFNLPEFSKDPQRIKIEFHCQCPQDPKTFKDNFTTITPNTGVSALE